MLRDYLQSCFSWRIWLLLASQDIKQRYRRSTLGPFWLTISTAVTVYTMGFLYGHLFHVDLKSYLPHLATSIVCWSLLSSLINESTNVFIDAEAYLKNFSLPYSLYLFRLLSRNYIIFFHNLLALLPLYFVFPGFLNWKIIFLIPALFIIWLCLLVYGMIFGFLGARYRDFSQIMQSVMQIAFYMSPVMWMPESLPAKYQWLVWANPFYQVLEILREPLMGNFIPWDAWASVLLIGILGLMLGGSAFARYKSRLIFWI